MKYLEDAEIEVYETLFLTVREDVARVYEAGDPGNMVRVLQGVQSFLIVSFPRDYALRALAELTIEGADRLIDTVKGSGESTRDGVFTACIFQSGACLGASAFDVRSYREENPCRQTATVRGNQIMTNTPPISNEKSN